MAIEINPDGYTYDDPNLPVTSWTPTTRRITHRCDVDDR
ncbi:hypothetical protein J2S62_002450 [Enteractinococcus fodinae]|uniref:Uncharacterized protein n=1 Tax=Enteractinococcus fodinae TaxID=684663 RepID=A0ABU2B3L1_9MICC|nr:hypothetical protein [Enteractinococcus fodinae]